LRRTLVRHNILRQPNNNLIMINAALRLEQILSNIPQQLYAVSNEAASAKPNADRWSSKEILGHLVDSASNNHQRFVRMQIENNLTLPGYLQNEWVAVQQWQQREWSDIIDLWKLYNQHILHIFKVVQEDKLANTVSLKGNTYTLQFIIDDYVDHMEHHLKQIFAQ